MHSHFSMFQLTLNLGGVFEQWYEISHRWESLECQRLLWGVDWNIVANNEHTVIGLC